ncbi:MAG: ankyrin repeat domain-containing protein [bacterium]|nr:ankyrin repeat domain-containing protein [bacterium]
MTDSPTHLSQDTINEFVVAAHFDFDKVRSMLETQPALLNENATWVETSIQAAAHVNRADIVEFLLGQGAPLDITTAAMLNQADDVRAMLEADPAMIDDTGAHNLPLLYYAAISGNIELAAFLYEKGAVVNVEDGITSPLHGAALFGRTDMAAWLIDHDANPYTVDFDGKTAHERAIQNGHAAIADLLSRFFPDDRA